MDYLKIKSFENPYFMGFTVLNDYEDAMIIGDNTHHLHSVVDISDSEDWNRINYSSENLLDRQIAYANCET